MKVRPQKEPGLQTGLQHSTSLQQQLSKRHWSQSWNSVSCNHVAGKDVEEAAVVGNSGDLRAAVAAAVAGVAAGRRADGAGGGTDRFGTLICGAFDAP